MDTHEQAWLLEQKHNQVSRATFFLDWLADISRKAAITVFETENLFRVIIERGGKSFVGTASDLIDAFFAAKDAFEMEAKGE